MRRRLLVLPITVVASLAWSGSALAADRLTLCIKKEGAVRVAATCKSRETPFQAISKSRVDALATRIRVLEDKVSRLATENAAQQTTIDGFTTLLSGVTRTAGPTLLFTGMNLQVVNGSGFTDDHANGLGNIIVGYNTGGGTKTGSHDLVVGDGHSFTTTSGVIVGNSNTLSGAYSLVAGFSSTASGLASFVGGGARNEASGQLSFASGNFNVANGFRSFVGGGNSSTASGADSFVGGGGSNTASSPDSFVGGGSANTARGFISFVGGGTNNNATGNLAGGRGVVRGRV